MKSFVTAIICLMALFLDGCGVKEETPVQLANPFTDCETSEEAERISGFEFESPEELEKWASETVIRAEKGGMTELIYISGGQEIRARKAPGNEDISGIYEDFGDIEDTELGGTEITVRGNKGLYNSVIWHDGDFSYSLSLSVPASAEDITALAALFIPGAETD